MNKSEQDEVFPYLFLGIGIMSLAWFLVYFFIGMYNFYKARKLLAFVISQNIFDNEYVNRYMNEKTWIFYTQECIFGYIREYPVLVYVNSPIDKYSRTTVQFNVFITRFNRTSVENISLPLIHW